MFWALLRTGWFDKHIIEHLYENVEHGKTAGETGGGHIGDVGADAQRCKWVDLGGAVAPERQARS